MPGESLVYYWVPADGDRADEPNVFVVHTAPTTLCVRDVVNAFPLPGTYHFRFKTAYKTGHVWMDAVDQSAPAPSFKGTFFVKVMRIAAPLLSSAPSASSSHSKTPVRATAGRGGAMGQRQRQQSERETTPARLGVSTPPSGATRAGLQRSGGSAGGATGVGMGVGLGGSTPAPSPSPRQQRRQRVQQGPERRLSADSDLLGGFRACSMERVDVGKTTRDSDNDRDSDNHDETLKRKRAVDAISAHLPRRERY